MRRLRSERTQPVWPRLTGWGCLLAAGWFALHPVGLHVAAMSSSVAGARPKPPVAEPTGDLEPTAPLVFCWQRGDLEAPVTWVLLDAGYEELDRVDGLETDVCVPDGSARSSLAGGGTFHWYVTGTASGWPVASNLQTLQIAVPGSGDATVR